jgi:DNA-binding MarR family transcriptional regulator
VTGPGDSSSRELAPALYVALGRLVRSLRQEVPSSEVGPSALSALVTLDGQGPLRAGALAEAEGVTAPSMTRIVNALEALGLVGREAHPSDGRGQVVAITPAGSRLLASGKEVKLAALQRRIDGLGDDERGRLAAALSVLEQLGGATIPVR